MHDRAASPAGLAPPATARRPASPPARRAPGAAALLLALLLGACASGPRSDGPPDAPRDRSPQGTPDAVPRVEPLRSGGPNKPYEVLGRSYTPETRDVPLREKGLASWYGRKFHGRRTASGEVYDMHAMTAAHKTMPLPSYARVRNPSNGRQIVVRVNDRGPFVTGRVIDLSHAAAMKLGVSGVAPVEVERLTFEAIRSGAWRRTAPAAPGDASPSERAGIAPAAAPLTTAASRAADPPDATGGAVMASSESLAGTTSTSGSAGTPSAAGSAATPPGVADAAVPADARAALARDRVVPPGAAMADAAGFWVQLGAFRERGGAEDFQQRVAAELDWLGPLMAVFSDAPLYRLQAGPYASLEDARGAAEQVRKALRLVPVIVERR